MIKDNETVVEVCREISSSHEGMIGIEFGCVAERILAAHNREIAELNRKIMDYECLLDKSPCGMIYQLGICDESGIFRRGCGILFTDEAETAKMPSIYHGDRFYIVPLKHAKLVRGVQK